MNEKTNRNHQSLTSGNRFRSPISIIIAFTVTVALTVGMLVFFGQSRIFDAIVDTYAVVVNHAAPEVWYICEWHDGDKSGQEGVEIQRASLLRERSLLPGRRAMYVCQGDCGDRGDVLFTYYDGRTDGKCRNHIDIDSEFHLWSECKNEPHEIIPVTIDRIARTYTAIPVNDDKYRHQGRCENISQKTFDSWFDSWVASDRSK